MHSTLYRYLLRRTQALITLMATCANVYTLSIAAGYQYLKSQLLISICKTTLCNYGLYFVLFVHVFSPVPANSRRSYSACFLFIAETDRKWYSFSAPKMWKWRFSFFSAEKFRFFVYFSFVFFSLWKRNLIFVIIFGRRKKGQGRLRSVSCRYSYYDVFLFDRCLLIIVSDVSFGVFTGWCYYVLLT